MAIDFEKIFGPTTIPYEIVELPVSIVRDMLDIDLGDLSVPLDNAQSPVFTGEAKESYMILRIIPDA